MSYYKIINGKRFDRSLLEKAESLLEGQGDGRISLEDAQQLFEATKDHNFITPNEVRTLRYILDHLRITDKAHQWLWDQLRKQTPVQRAIQSVMAEIFHFKTIRWQIDDADVEMQVEKYNNQTSFPLALREMIDEFINGIESSTSLRDIVSQRFEVALDDNEAITEKVKALLDTGTIYLFPSDYLDRIRAGELDFKYPPFVHRVEEYWPFGLRLPRLRDYYFIGFVSRTYWWDVYHTGYQ